MALKNEAMAREADELNGPSADGDPMGTPAFDETVLWKGRPDLALLSRTAFHTRTVGFYFAALIAISVAFGDLNAAIVCSALAIAAIGILHGLAWLSVRSTLYILTDTRLIMRIGMALETRVNVPLKHVQSANLRMRGGDHGDIALELGGERLLGYLLLWPHARPWRLARPEPMLRSVPDAERVAKLLADACAAHAPIERSLTKINVGSPAGARQMNGSAALARESDPVSVAREAAEVSKGGMKGATA